MRKSIILISLVEAVTFCSLASLVNLGHAQSVRPQVASFISRMGVDTVSIETYTVLNNHLYGKAFIRVPEDYIGEFSIHFNHDGSIREFNVTAMNPSNSSLPFEAKSGAFEYRLNMNCSNDTCTYYNADPSFNGERKFVHPAKRVDFVGGWVPFISLMEWNCVRLVKSGQKQLPITMINHNIGVYDLAVEHGRDEVIFGGPFLEYTKIRIDRDGRILSVNGMGTPWNYEVSRSEPFNIDVIAARMTKTPGIGIPSPTETVVRKIRGANVSVTYGRPYKRGRAIFGGVVPLDSVWRTGANAPTVLQTDRDIMIVGKRIPKGAYSVYTVPGNGKWTLILNTDTNTWPTDPDRSKDFTSVSIPSRKTSTVAQQFTIDLAETGSGGEIRMMWDDVVAIVTFEVL